SNRSSLLRSASIWWANGSPWGHQDGRLSTSPDSWRELKKSRSDTRQSESSTHDSSPCMRHTPRPSCTLQFFVSITYWRRTKDGAKVTFGLTSSELCETASTSSARCQGSGYSCRKRTYT